MFAAVTSVALVGIEPCPVRVEAHVGTGQKASFHVVGLPDAAVREAKERVRAAIASSGLAFPRRRVVVNLSPADLPKAGTAYDLPIALAILAAARLIATGAAEVVALGELALDGAVRPTRGGLGAALLARGRRVPCVVPVEAAVEARAATDVDVRGVAHLSEAISAALGDTVGSAADGAPADGAAEDETAPLEPIPDLADVRGQEGPRRALEVAAAGGHHLLMTGPPGAGKTMLARALPGLLPPLGPEHRFQVMMAWAAAGRGRNGTTLPPFRAPHHSATMAALVGGGSGIPVPGEVTLAHHGVLFLDELGEFPSHALDALRQPLEEGWVQVARRGVSVRFPAAFQAVAATNPCPCGYKGDHLVACRCTPQALDRYRRRLSGPLLDRFDLQVRVARVQPGVLSGPGGEASAEVAQRVMAARRRQANRGRVNRDLTRGELDEWQWSVESVRLLERALSSQALTARGWDRVRRVAVTIADLAASDAVTPAHVAEALVFRGTV